MNDDEWLARQFEAHREHLRSVAYRMLGSASEADDAVQESWLRLSRAGTEGVDNLGGWLTTVTCRVCLDMLRSRSARREDPLGEWMIEPASGSNGSDPEHAALLADSVGPALLVVLDTLAPAERLAFVLHDMFGMPFDDIAPIVERSPAATRQLASRARRRVHGAEPATDPGPDRRRQIVDAFLAASRDGDFGALLTMLDPEVVLRADEASTGTAAARRPRGAPDLRSEVRGVDAVARVFAGRAQAAVPALIDGSPGAVWASGAAPRAAFTFVVDGGRITEIAIVADPGELARLDVVMGDN